MRRSSSAWFMIFGSPLVAMALAPCGAQAQNANDGSAGQPSNTSLEALANEARVHVQATAGVWYASLSGENRFGTSATGTDMRIDQALGLKDNEAAFSGSVTLFIDDRWVVLLDGFDFSTNSSLPTPIGIRVNGANFAAGTRITSTFGLTSAGAIAGYDFLGNLYEKFSGKSDGGGPVDIRAYVIGGFRAINVDHELNISGGPNLAFDEWGATANLGVRLAIGLGPEMPGKGRWDIGVALAYGLGGSASGDLSTFDLDFGIHYTVVDSFGLVLGYRQMDINLDADDASQPYRWDGRIAGLFFGGEMKF